jgi:hypothetical protein
MPQIRRQQSLIPKKKRLQVKFLLKDCFTAAENFEKLASMVWQLNGRKRAKKIGPGSEKRRMRNRKKLRFRRTLYLIGSFDVKKILPDNSECSDLGAGCARGGGYPAKPMRGSNSTYRAVEVGVNEHWTTKRGRASEYEFRFGFSV